MRRWAQEEELQRGGIPGARRSTPARVCSTSQAVPGTGPSRSIPGGRFPRTLRQVCVSRTRRCPQSPKWPAPEELSRDSARPTIGPTTHLRSSGLELLGEEPTSIFELEHPGITPGHLREGGDVENFDEQRIAGPAKRNEGVSRSERLISLPPRNSEYSLSSLHGYGTREVVDLGEVDIANVVGLDTASQLRARCGAKWRTRTLSLFLICPPVHSWVSILKTSPTKCSKVRLRSASSFAEALSPTCLGARLLTWLNSHNGWDLRASRVVSGVFSSLQVSHSLPSVHEALLLVRRDERVDLRSGSQHMRSVSRMIQYAP